ncbi:MMtag superfamily domain-containing protein [Histoplasma capsulatum]|uniref:MMtag superfamily domain-containing protein n=1 Tax=Ajellomyces capsulatus TaxID=5037 RepID=A0A8A1MBK7_AJECA|nr:MMtag superfamily domain-containing protein [Histoplasma capsulatum]
MDLVASIRKEGSRGGRDSFKWSDVKTSTHRENYLGHSLMAPVGRWQQNRDLSWYAKGDKDAAGSAEEAAAKLRSEREEEIKRIKEAEQEAMARALGLPVASRSSNNANMTPLGGKEVERAIQESNAADEGAQDGGGSRGVGFGSFRGTGGTKAGDQGDRMEGTGYEMVPENGLEQRGTRDGRGTRGGCEIMGFDTRAARDRLGGEDIVRDQVIWTPIKGTVHYLDHGAKTDGGGEARGRSVPVNGALLPLSVEVIMIAVPGGTKTMIEEDRKEQND